MNLLNRFVDQCATEGVKVSVRGAPLSMMLATHAEKCAAGFHAYGVDPVTKVLTVKCTFCDFVEKPA